MSRWSDSNLAVIVSRDSGAAIQETVGRLVFWIAASAFGLLAMTR
ncbi:MAG TPA: hypothetical protein VMS87_00610 [Roseiarcus sp.]|nr:hypothetical protein [Roseiarcus sp.]